MSATKACYKDWTRICGNHCKQVSCRYVSNGSEVHQIDNCDKRCKNLCYNYTHDYDCNIIALSLFKKCYSDCRYTCIPRIVKLLIILSILSVLLVFTVGVIIHKGLYTKRSRALSYEVLYDCEYD